MTPERRSRLEAKGWKFGNFNDFLEMTTEEAALTNIRFGLAKLIREGRAGNCMTQTELALACGTSQNRVSKIEHGSHAVSLDLMVKAALATGACVKSIGEAIANSEPKIMVRPD